MRILLQLQLWCLIFLLFLVFSSSSSDIFGSFWIFFFLVGEFIFPNTIEENWKNWQRFKAVGGALWLDESGGKGFKPSNHWETEQAWIFFFFLKKNLMRNKALLDHPESSLHNRKSKVFFFFLSKLTLKKGQNFKQIYFLCQPNSIPRRFILFYFWFLNLVKYLIHHVKLNS